MYSGEPYTLKGVRMVRGRGFEDLLLKGSKASNLLAHNIGKIPKFEKLIATMRSRGLSASIILQSKSQLKAIYKDHADGIEGNCDTVLFLGGKERTTIKELTEILGKETIDLYTTSDTRGSSQSYGVNYQKTGKDLMSQDEIAVMDGSKCIMQLRGVRPFLSEKYDITKHKQYPLLSDFDEKNAFDIEKYVKNLAKLKLKSDLIISNSRFSPDSKVSIQYSINSPIGSL